MEQEENNSFEEMYAGDAFYDDSNVAYELVNQFVQSLSGNETEEQLNELIGNAIDEIHGIAATVSREFIRDLILDTLKQKVCDGQYT